MWASRPFLTRIQSTELTVWKRPRTAETRPSVVLPEVSHSLSPIPAGGCTQDNQLSQLAASNTRAFDSTSVKATTNLCTVKYLPPRHESQLIKLIGKRCLVNCHLNGQPMEALWDTGAQASIVNDAWRQQHLQDTVIQPLEELLGEATLTGLAANNTEILFIGWVEISFQLDGGS